MKVLHITSPKTWRGGEQQLTYLAEELRKKDIEQVIMCPFNSAVHRYCLKNHFSHVTYFKGFSANPMVAFRVFHLCKREGVDLIHVHDSHAHNFAILAAVLTNNRVPIIVSRRVDFPVGDTSLSMYKYNHAHIAKILCVSNAIMDVMRPSIEHPSRLAVVHSGIDLSRFDGVKKQDLLRKEFNISPDTKVIGNVAALAPHKDYPTFIRMAKKLIDEGMKAHFFGIGEGPSRKEVEQCIEAEGMEQHITLTGFRENIVDLLSSLDLFVISSKTEGLGTSILDAIACKVPVVATKAGGIVEVIQHEVNGLLAEVEDPDSLAEQVNRLIDDESLQQTYVAKGLELVQNFSKEQMAAKTLANYQDSVSLFESQERSE